jgi:hypothetical protein
MIYEVYRTPGKPLRWWQKAIGFTAVWGCLLAYPFVVTVTNNDNWPEHGK